MIASELCASLQSLCSYSSLLVLETELTYEFIGLIYGKQALYLWPIIPLLCWTLVVEGSGERWEKKG